MFGGHIWELAIILGLALIVFGPKRLPEIGGALGKGIREFKQSTAELADMGTSNQQLTPVPVTQPVSAAPTPMPTAAYESEAGSIPGPVPHQNAG